MKANLRKENSSLREALFNQRVVIAQCGRARGGKGGLQSILQEDPNCLKRKLDYYFFLLAFRNVRLQPTRWECYESAQVRSWSLVSLRSDNAKTPQGKCINVVDHFTSAGLKAPPSLPALV